MSDNNTVIGASIQLDASQANASTKEFNKNIKDVNTSLKDTGAAAKSAGKDIGGAGENFSKLKEQIASVSPAAAGAAEGAGKLNGALKVLAANPIVAVLTALVAICTLVYKAFTNTFEGGEKVEQVFAGIKAVGQSLLDNLDKIGTALLQIAKFDFSGAIKTFKGVADAAGSAYTQMAALTKQAQQLARDQADNDLDQAKRQAKLADLRAKVADGDISAAERKKAAQELLVESQANAKEDMKLAKDVADNQIAQFLVEKDGADKYYAEIKKIQADQIRNQTENSNELKQIGKQVTAAEKQERAERAAAAKDAAEKQKALREQYAAANTQLTKLQQENQLLTIKDGYQKELQQLENKVADEKAANLKAFNDKKITKQQYLEIEAAEEVKANLLRDALTEKHNADVAKKEADFQKELNAITTKTRLDGIVDSRQLEKVQLEIGYQEKLQQAIEHYKDDADKLFQIKQALDAQYKAEQEKIDEKNAKADAKKKLEDSLKGANGIVDDPKATFQAKKDAVDAEAALNQSLFDQKLTTEQQYTDNVNNLAEARKKIKQQEMDLAYQSAGIVTGLFDAVAEAAGKQTVIGKALSVATTTINTIESAVKSFNAYADIPIVGPALGAVAAAAAAVSGYNNVKKILAVQIPGQGSGGISAPSGITTPAAPLAPIAATTQLDANSINGIGNAAAGGVNRDVRAYVVEQDNAAATSRAARLAGAAVLGGN